MGVSGKEAVNNDDTRTVEFDDYQRKIVKYDLLKPEGKEKVSVGLVEKILGLTGEAGEVADKFKKIIRDKSGEISEADKVEIVKELGDVLWYVATVARYLEVPFSEVARTNVAKLESRAKREKLSGDGDNR